jgi:methionyl-tRNA synthetase
MSEKILVAVAWPYASADIHVGNITGAYLPADIFARYHRLKGNDVAMVSGSDSHGTPITVRADAENEIPENVYKGFHARFLDLFQRTGISYDLFTSTHTDTHFKVSQSIFLALKENGYLYPETQPQWYSAQQNRFLPDRYVEGTCYICGFENARGDQCDNCGNVLESNQLIEPRSKIDGSTPELKETEHFFLDMGKLESAVVEFLTARQDYWRPNVVRQSLGSIKSNPLRGRPITRDLDWGIPIPIEGWDGKCLYVWFEAVIGYLSAPVEWSKLNGSPDAWHDWWYNPDAKAYYFIGKDNIPFHAIMWPAELVGAGEWFGKIFEDKAGTALTLPYDVPANEFMNLEKQKISGSRNWVVDGLDFLERYDPDPLRYYLTVNMPENRDTDWDWGEFVARNNNELVATWGNLANRILGFAYKHWDGTVPDPGELRPGDLELIANVEASFKTIGELIESIHLRAALREAIATASTVNQYLDQNAPWFEIKTDKDQAAKSVYTAMKAIDSLKILLAPFLPFTSERLHGFLGYTQPIFGTQQVDEVSDSLGTHQALRYIPGEASGKWEPSDLQPGSPFEKPSPLFKKLDPEVADEEREKMGRGEE